MKIHSNDPFLSFLGRDSRPVSGVIQAKQKLRENSRYALSPQQQMTAPLDNNSKRQVKVNNIESQLELLLSESDLSMKPYKPVRVLSGEQTFSQNEDLSATQNMLSGTTAT